jgi:hypothetical protein
VATGTLRLVGFFRDQYELLAPVLTALASVFGGIAVYGMTQSKEPDPLSRTPVLRR